MKLHCSKCGMELIATRRALKNKQLVVNLIDPHECDDKHLDNITDAQTSQFTPTVPDSKRRELERPFRFEPGDRRQEIRTSAPSNLLRHLKSQPTTQPESYDEF